MWYFYEINLVGGTFTGIFVGDFSRDEISSGQFKIFLMKKSSWKMAKNFFMNDLLEGSEKKEISKQFSKRR